MAKVTFEKDGRVTVEEEQKETSIMDKVTGALKNVVVPVAVAAAAITYIVNTTETWVDLFDLCSKK